MPNTIRFLFRPSSRFVSPRNRISKVVVLGQEQARQQEIDRMRAEHQAEFDKIEEEMPELDELLSICTEPPHEWLEERWS